MVALENLATAVLNGIVWGVLIALIALGLNLIFGLLEIVNLAHGSLFMAGAVGAFFVIQATGSFWIALIVAPIAVGLIGVALERIVLRPIEDDIPITVIATFGLMMIFQHVSLLTFGSGSSTITAPITARFSVFGVTYPFYRIVVAVLAIALMAGLYVFLQRTRHGMWMRGVRQNREVAAALGVPTSRVYMLTFGLGALFAALAGVLLAPIVSVNHLMGLDILAIAFVVVIVGGLGSLSGVLVASLLFALLDNVGSTLVNDPTNVRLAVFALMIAFVLYRPEGLFESS